MTATVNMACVYSESCEYIAADMVGFGDLWSTNDTYLYDIQLVIAK